MLTDIRGRKSSQYAFGAVLGMVVKQTLCHGLPDSGRYGDGGRKVRHMG
jgi:hypothetical protein